MPHLMTNHWPEAFSMALFVVAALTLLTTLLAAMQVGPGVFKEVLGGSPRW
jgi:hypothetical protein